MSSATLPGSARFGVMGLGVMGQNLALNVERNGFPVAVWSRTAAEVDAFTKGKAQGKKLKGYTDVREFALSLERPRRILMMVKAGEATDWTIAQVAPFLDKGDILIDGGNSHFADTQRREKGLAAAGLHFVGSGVSGGETGALWGPSLMPGGTKDAWQHIQPIFAAIAAKVDDGPCVTYVGPDGAGHFVKMVHNGIEYGDMQLIAEAYDLLRRGLGMEASELADTFAQWNTGPLESFLIEITASIFTVKDQDTGKPLVDLILDKAGQKGTGKWTSSVALDLGVAVPTIHAAIEARYLSSLKEQRVAASKMFAVTPTQDDPFARASYGGDRKEFISVVHDALYASKICSYAQGMALIRAGSDEHKWGIDLAELARIWKGGCIIRARFLDPIKQAFRRQPQLANLLLDVDFRDWLNQPKSQRNWRAAVSLGMSLGIPTMAMSASLAYFDTYRTASLPQNLTQAQRDFFGSHLYERTDKSQLGPVHTDWVGITAKP